MEEELIPEWMKKLPLNPAKMENEDYLSEEGRKLAETKAIEIQEEVFCKLEGDCRIPETPELQTEKSALDEFLDGKHYGIDFLGEPLYHDNPRVCVQQLNNAIGSNHLQYYSKWDENNTRINSITVDINMRILESNILERDVLIKIDELCYKIGQLLKPKITQNGKN